MNDSPQERRDGRRQYSEHDGRSALCITMTPDGTTQPNAGACPLDVVDVRRGRLDDGSLRRCHEASQHGREIVDVSEREVFGASACSMKHLASGSALIETSDHDRELRAPGFDAPHEMSNSGPAPAAQSNDEKGRTLIAQPLDELIAIRMELEFERRVAGTHGQRPTEGVVLPSGHHDPGQHRYLHR
jgi:hypothetical protein